MRRFKTHMGRTGAPCGQIGGSLECFIDQNPAWHTVETVRLSIQGDINSRQMLKNRNKESHNTEILMTQVFINSRSGFVKGSHNRWYVTVFNPVSADCLEKSKFKARRHSAGQSVNGVFAGDKYSNLPVGIDEVKIPSNPCLQSFEGIFEGLIDQVRIDHRCSNRTMSECLLNDKDIRSSGIQASCEAVPETVRCNSFINACFGYPLIETTLDLPGCNSLLQLAEDKGLGLCEYLFPFFQISIQDRPQFTVNEASYFLSPLGLNGNSLLQKINIVDIQINQFRQPYSGMQEEIDNSQISICLPAFLRPDCLQKISFLVLCQKYRRLPVLVLNLDACSRIMIDITGLSQPSEESLDGCPGSIDGRGLFRLSVGLGLNRLGKKESVDFYGSDSLDIVVISKMVEQQIQVALLSTDSMGRSAVGELMIHVIFDCILECHDFSLPGQSDKFTFARDTELRIVSRSNSYPARSGFYFITHGNSGQLEAVCFPICFFLKMTVAVKFPPLRLCPSNELFFLHFLHCGLLFGLIMTLKLTTQQCSEIVDKSRYMRITRLEND